MSIPFVAQFVLVAGSALALAVQKKRAIDPCIGHEYESPKKRHDCGKKPDVPLKFKRQIDLANEMPIDAEEDTLVLSNSVQTPCEKVVDREQKSDDIVPCPQKVIADKTKAVVESGVHESCTEKSVEPELKSSHGTLPASGPAKVHGSEPRNEVGGKMRLKPILNKVGNGVTKTAGSSSPIKVKRVGLVKKENLTQNNNNNVLGPICID